MSYQLTRESDVPKKSKHGIDLEVYPKIDDCGVVFVSTQNGHNQEFLDKQSTFVYVILEGRGTFFLDDEPVDVARGDMISIDPNTRIYYKGELKMVLITNPAWRPENEVETRSSIW